MKFRVISIARSRQGSRSPVRVVEQTTGREVGWINRYLDREYVRRLADTDSAPVRARSAALCPLVGKYSSHRRRRRNEISPNRRCWIMCVSSPVHSRGLPASTINARVAVADRALRNEFPDAPCQIARAFIRHICAAGPMGIGRPRVGNQPIAGQGAQTHHRAAVRRRGGALLVQLSHLTRPGHRRSDAAARTTVAEVLALNPRRRAAFRSADPRSRQRQQDPFPAAGSGNRFNCSIIICGWNGPILAPRLCSFR